MEALANVVVIVHLAYFVFVTGGFLCIVIGAAQGWRWISNPWFRVVHILFVFLVLAEDLGRVNCPLNALESTLRSSASNDLEASSGMGYLLDQLLHHTIPARVLDDMYWTLGLALLLLFFFVPPHFRKIDSGRRQAGT